MDSISSSASSRWADDRRIEEVALANTHLMGDTRHEGHVYGGAWIYGDGIVHLGNNNLHANTINVQHITVMNRSQSVTHDGPAFPRYKHSQHMTKDVQLPLAERVQRLPLDPAFLQHSDSTTMSAAPYHPIDDNTSLAQLLSAKIAPPNRAYKDSNSKVLERQQDEVYSKLTHAVGRVSPTFHEFRTSHTQSCESSRPWVADQDNTAEQGDQIFHCHLCGTKKPNRYRLTKHLRRHVRLGSPLSRRSRTRQR